MVSGEAITQPHGKITPDPSRHSSLMYVDCRLYTPRGDALARPYMVAGNIRERAS